MSQSMNKDFRYLVQARACHASQLAFDPFIAK